MLCNDGLSVGLEPEVQSRMNMLQISALKKYLMQCNLGQAHTLPKGVRALWPPKN